MARMQKKTIVEQLDAVSYDALAKFIPSKETLTYFNFVRIVNIDNPDFNSIPPMHFKMIDDMLSGYGKKAPKNYRFVNMFHRGAGKTTVGAELLILFLAALGHEVLGLSHDIGIIYIADSMENGAKNLSKNMQARYENSIYLQDKIPKAEFQNASIELKNSHGKYVSVKLYGAKTGVRGVKLRGMRPQIAIIDDVLSDDDARSDVAIESISNTIFKAVLPALHPDPKLKRVIWNGTPFSHKDPFYKAAESGAWVTNLYPVCETFPCSREEFKGSWEDRFTYDIILDQYEAAVATSTLQAFYQEYMLRITSDEDRLIHESDIKWFDRQTLLKRRNELYFYITSDIAVSTKSSADFTVLGVWAVDRNKNRYLVDGICRKQSVTKTLEDLLELYEEYRPQLIGLERSGQQLGIIDLFRDEALKRGVALPIAQGKNQKHIGIAPVGDKVTRLVTTSHWFKQHKIYLPEDWKQSELVQELLDEINFATRDGIKSRHDDAVDMMSQFDQMNVFYPDGNITTENIINRRARVSSMYSPFQGNFEEEEPESYTAYDDFLFK